ncbi:MAG: DUF4058 family protein [Planctomycetaceae bacterium]|nr:DUF4058 family protein [Planctomycetaceae bacterium]
MPLRDRFRPPVWARSSWEGFHGGWPMAIVQQIAPLLPNDFTAEPRVHLGSYFEIDVCAYENELPRAAWPSPANGSGVMATATWAPPEPTLIVDADLADQYEYEVLVFDQSRGRHLVAAVEIVSPANKDRSENRRAFVTKCAALLQQGVCVSIVDLVTTRRFNLYTELLALLDRKDPAFAPDPPSIYAVTCRCRKIGQVSKLESWAYPLAVGKPLPTLPVWLSDELSVSLELESSYEETCRVLRIS